MFMSSFKYSILLCLVINILNTSSEIQFCDTQLITISIAASNEPFTKDPEKVEPYFTYLTVLEMVLYDIKHNEKDTIEFLRQYYANNETILEKIDEFEVNVYQHSPIWWYKQECFLSSLINRALQTMDMKILINMASFFYDLCKQINDFHKKKFNSSQSLTVYRCLKLSKDNFEKLQQNDGVYLSFNSFLLTTFDQEFENEICSKFSENDNDALLVLIQIKIDDITSKFTPYAWLNHVSSKKEILFSMKSVYRLSKIVKNTRNIWQIELFGINQNDSLFGFSLALISSRVSTFKGWEKLGQMMISMRQDKHAENLYKILLESIDDYEEMIRLYTKLGTIKFTNGSYEEAQFFFEKILHIQENILPRNDIDLASTYSTIGIANSKMGKYENALVFHRKALTIRQSIFPSNHRDVAVSYDNIAIVYSKMGNHLMALSYYEKALQINEQVLPFYDPDRAINYNNIAGEYQDIGDYKKALGFFEKSLQIQETILRSDDPELAFAYDNIAGVYQKLGEYDKALLFYEKSLKISEKVLHPYHPELAITYHNIAFLKFHTLDYDDSLVLYQKAIEIAHKSLPANHPTIAGFYTNIADVYKAMKQWSTALTFYEKALEIQKEILPEYHSDFVLSYTNIGEIYYENGKYSKALAFFELGLKIGEVILSENDPRLEILRQRIALIEKEL